MASVGSPSSAVGGNAVQGNWGKAAMYAAGALTMGAATTVFNATRIVVKAGNALRAGQMAGGSIKASRTASRIAGRMWTGWGRATKTKAPNGSPWRINGTREWRGPIRKHNAWSSNLTNSTKGRHDHFNFHIVHRKPWFRR